MSFQPVLPFGGYSGWAFLNRTRETQQEAFNTSSQMQRDTDYFAENISKVETAEDLVNNRRLLSVALGAFGLDDDINNKYFIQKILEDGSLDEGALANKLSDKRYLEFTRAFGFGDFDTPNTVLSTLPDEINSAYREKQFEIAVGEQNSDMRLALSLDRELGNIADLDTSVNGKWFTVMGNAPLRSLFEEAFGMPSSVGTLDIDRQLDIFKENAEKMFGTSDLSEINSAENKTDLVRNFLVRSEINATLSNYSPASAALTLLQSSNTRGLFG
ncbi:MAG: DUF1217 domain-containing protein [Paracoccaceae bacterium]